MGRSKRYDKELERLFVDYYEGGVKEGGLTPREWSDFIQKTSEEIKTKKRSINSTLQSMLVEYVLEHKRELVKGDVGEVKHQVLNENKRLAGLKRNKAERQLEKEGEFASKTLAKKVERIQKRSLKYQGNLESLRSFLPKFTVKQVFKLVKKEFLSRVKVRVRGAASDKIGVGRKVFSIEGFKARFL